MAGNGLRTEGRHIQVTAASIESGDPVCVVALTGVAQYDTDASGKVVIDRNGTYDLSVAAVNAQGNSAVVEGDSIYYNSGDTPKLNKKSAGVLFGYALEGITSGSTATIEVALK